MNLLHWEKILTDDFLPHFEDQQRTEAQGVMNPRPLQYEELWQGMPVYWHRESRGGYGYTEEIIAVVLRLGKKRVGLAVLQYACARLIVQPASSRRAGLVAPPGASRQRLI